MKRLATVMAAVLVLGGVGGVVALQYWSPSQLFQYVAASWHKPKMATYKGEDADHWIALLRDKDLPTRRDAAYALAEIGKDGIDETALASLRSAFPDTDELTSVRIARAIVEISGPDDNTRAYLEKLARPDSNTDGDYSDHQAVTEAADTLKIIDRETAAQAAAMPAQARLDAATAALRKAQADANARLQGDGEYQNLLKVARPVVRPEVTDSGYNGLSAQELADQYEQRFLANDPALVAATAARDKAAADVAAAQP